MAGLNVALDDVLHFDVVTHGSDGTSLDADTVPSWSVFEEDNDTPLLTSNFTKRGSITGSYRASVTVSTANGFEVGKWYNIVSTATVATKAGRCVSMTFRVDPAESIGTVNDASATATSFITTLPATADDFYNGSYLLFTSGALAGQARKVSNYEGASKTVTLAAALTAAPANGVGILVVGRSGN